ncbi:hypothetical protein [Brevundimonas lenta]|uniref:Uncharacterized protein n=1 Tax=Brevundimonas lenta TaxID=424796 RepID=A0A7W6JFP5_9CAUL|nr:hypothetical protein [Brevundimonas lenta]MBB4084293.1 hypothetical protein [Brevundimonas lenta]
MTGRVFVFAAAFAVASLVNVTAHNGATPVTAMTRVAANPTCVAACQAAFNAEDQRCRQMDLQGGWRGAVYTPCISYARYVFNNCVAACPA